MSKRNRVAKLIVFPYVVFTFLIGWCICCIDKKGNRQNKKALTKHFAHHRAIT
jgi:hypothetical protein